MNNKWLNLLIGALLAIFIQVFFLNNVSFYGLFNPKIYPIVLLLLPRNIKPVYLMLIGFLFGAIVDMLCNTYGIGMASSVFICLLKPYIVKLLYNKSEEEEEDISVSIQGSTFVFAYLWIGLIIFHIYYFFVELGEVTNVLYILFKSFLSGTLATAIYGIFYLMYVNSPKKIK